MKKIKRLLKVRLKNLLKSKTKDYEKESILANTAKTYINSIMMIDDNERRANLKEKANCIRQDALIVKINARSTLSELNEIVEKADEIRKEHNCNCTLFIKII